MKLLRYGSAGHEQPGMLDTSGQIRALSSIVPQIDSFVLSPRELVKLRKIKPESLPVVKGYPRLGVPFIGIGKFIGVGLNYADHAAEANLPIPGEPILCPKARPSLIGKLSWASSSAAKRSMLRRRTRLITWLAIAS